MRKPPKLSLAEWSEIYYALESKAMQLRNGDYGESDDDCDVDVWACQLEAIAEKIGEDGRNMVSAKEFATAELKCRHQAVDAYESGKGGTIMRTQFVRPTLIRRRCKELGKRVGRGFIHALDLIVAEKIEAACRSHNGGRKTLDRQLALYVFGRFK
jgi:hypothetical protein